MRFTIIPDAEIWEGAVRRVFAAPDGDLTNTDVYPVEVLVDSVTLTSGESNIRVSLRCELDDGDLDKLAAGGHVWFSSYGGLMPVSCDVKGPGE